MNKNEAIHIRGLLQNQLIRICHLSLEMHKEQQHIEDLMRIIDIHILNNEQQEESK